MQGNDRARHRTADHLGTETAAMAPAYVYPASDADSGDTVGEITAIAGGPTGTR